MRKPWLSGPTRWTIRGRKQQQHWKVINTEASPETCKRAVECSREISPDS